MSDSEMDEIREIGFTINDACESATNSEFEISDIYRPKKISPTEYDRFIPQRPVDIGQASNFETKEFLFSQKLFNCTHSVNEQCNSATCGAELSQADQV